LEIRSVLFLAIMQPEAALAGKITSLAVKAGALLVVLFLPAQFALDLQLLGGLWILQTFPALIFGLHTGISGRMVSSPDGR
jgi:solute:Na+ symporter, SSS family